MELPVCEQEKIITDAWDFRGRPADKSKTGGWTSASMILGVETNERLTTLGIAFNLVTYLTGVMHLGTAASANIVTNFLGTSFMLCLLGGFVADSFLGRYMTIAIFTAVQALGATMLTISTMIPSLRPPKCKDNTPCIPANATQLGVLYMALFLTALGTGGLKSSVSGFGSDQFDDIDKDEKVQMEKFFNWFYFIVSIGALAAVTMLVYIEDNVGRPWGYGICACAIVIGLVFFVAGTRRYRFKKLVGSPLTQIVAVFVGSWRKRRLDLPSDSSLLFDVDDTLALGGKKKKMKLPHSKRFRFLDKAAIKDTDIPTPEEDTRRSRWYLSTVTDIEEVKMVLKMLPIWATTIMFWTIHAQMTTFSVQQATKMDRHIITNQSFQIPPASLTAVLVASILLTVPIYDRIFIPIIRRLLHSPQYILTSLRKVGIGLVFSIFAMIAAALTELKRLEVATHPDPDNYNNNKMHSVFWLIPQFFLVGVGESFMYSGQLGFFLKECPKGMKTTGTGLFLTTLSLGFFFSTLIVTVVHKITGDKHPWLADNLNHGRLYNFYWLLGGMSLVNFIAFLVFARRHVYNETWLAAEKLDDINEMEKLDDRISA